MMIVRSVKKLVGCLRGRDVVRGRGLCAINPNYIAWQAFPHQVK
jgi:hypothetical protein